MKQKSSTVLRSMGVLSICLAVIFCLFCGSASADTDGTCGNDLQWGLDTSGNLVISGTGAMDSYSAVDPAPWANQVTSVTIKDDLLFGLLYHCYCYRYCG